VADMPAKDAVRSAEAIFDLMALPLLYCMGPGAGDALQIVFVNEVLLDVAQIVIRPVAGVLEETAIPILDLPRCIGSPDDVRKVLHQVCGR
jgi:hypothetical protein